MRPETDHPFIQWGSNEREKTFPVQIFVLRLSGFVVKTTQIIIQSESNTAQILESLANMFENGRL